MKSLLVCLSLSVLCAAPAVAQSPVSAELRAALDRAPNTKKARNIILFIGDGMGVSSVTAGRILAGQNRGRDGASYRLTFESLPYTGLSKTYSADKFVTDSANGISAITTGVKTINAAIGVDATVKSGDCASSQRARVATLAEILKTQGKTTGIVTTAGLTDATPAGAYGHVPSRGWRSDAELPADAAKAGCIDLARQLVEAPETTRIDVALGGDRARFLTEAQGGRRKDRDLTALWRARPAAAVVTDKAALSAVDTRKTKTLLGLFSEGDLLSVVDHKGQGSTPTLEDMTRKAISVLAQNEDGFFLLVESASIDKWHHENNALRALTDVDELDKAVKAAMEMTDASETLIIVTADHSHSLTLSAGSTRNEPILGLSRKNGVDEPDRNGQPRLTLNYATGPGARPAGSPALTQDEALSPDFHQTALTPMSSAQHAGEDVPVYASGPFAHLLSGTVESTFLYEVMRFAATSDRK
ncbi:alkaline phosphatase [Asticcacaulis sp. AND118]|uniref:alkaline phosphatase n=1 Tax=Asticcacaulis sp. AND118 TaxID=2840468 RepID=UPI001CFF82EB|nr:alkaline phosphatase [Asticcacaulis sp. AND118]UDF04998.1 alkaline phosphatase [Asticcacaulis sp. AND118]